MDELFSLTVTETTEKTYFTGNTYMDKYKNSVLKEVVQTGDYHSVAEKYNIPLATVYSWLKLAKLKPKDYNLRLKNRSVPKKTDDVASLKRENAMYQKVNEALGSKVRRIYEILGE